MTRKPRRAFSCARSSLRQPFASTRSAPSPFGCTSDMEKTDFAYMKNRGSPPPPPGQSCSVGGAPPRCRDVVEGVERIANNSRAWPHAGPIVGCQRHHVPRLEPHVARVASGARAALPRGPRDEIGRNSLPMLTSTFSHTYLIHLGFNMWALREPSQIQLCRSATAARSNFGPRT